jgi:hypothetical protein
LGVSEEHIAPETLAATCSTTQHRKPEHLINKYAPQSRIHYVEGIKHKIPFPKGQLPETLQYFV